MAELVDAQDSKSCDRKVMRVRFSLAAPRKIPLRRDFCYPRRMKKALLVFACIPFLSGCSHSPAIESPTNPVIPSATSSSAPSEIVPVQVDEPTPQYTQAPGQPYEKLSFILPEGLSVEYVSSIQSLNLYETKGEGSTLDRSKIFIRFFDANRFLTLSTVTIFETTDLTVGTEPYVARRHDIEKKSGVANFPGQPTWRNQRHLVTDTRKSDGFDRYYVIAKSPDMELHAYENFLASVKIR